jgi:hypothetical protein
VARKVVAQNPAQRRPGINRAQLKALAAQQAMSNAPARTVTPRPGDDAASGALDLSGLAAARRRPVLTREQEFAYIRADLVRLVIVSALLLVVLVVTLMVLR